MARLAQLATRTGTPSVPVDLRRAQIDLSRPGGGVQRTDLYEAYWAPITEVCLNPKKHNSETDEELSLDPASPTISVMSEAVKQFSDIDWVGPKNGFHKCPITNASDVGEGLPRVKNQPSDDTLRPSLSDSGLRFTVNSHCPTSENLN